MPACSGKLTFVTGVLALSLSASSFAPDQRAVSRPCLPCMVQISSDGADLFRTWAVILLTDWDRWQ
ncbi:hypothetical protein [Silvimonas iriomotensis]|uniref:Secreted protein n=1 Tax=Silvimonas iriomotensis TaxID=449662 RepID=A0ABQ2PAC4_9NEIS|nr:hypothetical protein [Silvimonas iriomotensis]GGP22339.1 hypothetical protein GCM10010970_24740 [Silvimonas iriomotensis]